MIGEPAPPISIKDGEALHICEKEADSQAEAADSLRDLWQPDQVHEPTAGHFCNGQGVEDAATDDLECAQAVC